MLTTFYDAAPHESAFSLLVAASAATLDKRIHRTSAVAFRRCAPLVNTLPCRVSVFDSLTQGAYGSPIHVLETHTLFNYFCLGMEPSLRHRLKNQLIFGEHSRTCTPRLPLFVNCANRFGLDCPECTRHSQTEIGRRASLCHLCIPFIRYCPIHLCKLVISDPCSFTETKAWGAENKINRKNGETFAQYSNYLSLQDPISNGRKFLNARLDDLGYRHETGRIFLKELTRDFDAFYSSDFVDHRLNFLCRAMPIPEMTVRVLSRPERALHPVYVTLMLLFLRSSEGMQKRSTKVRRSVQSKMIETLKMAPSRLSRLGVASKKRQQWLSHLERFKESSRTQIRAQAPALWIWLYRHDQTWLNANQVPRRRPSGKRPNASVPFALRQIFIDGSEYLDVDSTKPPSLHSSYQTRILLGLDDYSFAKLTAEVPIQGAFSQLPAGKEIFVTRRVEWAISDLDNHAESVHEAAIARRANLRITTIRKFACYENLYMYRSSEGKKLW